MKIDTKNASNTIISPSCILTENKNIILNDGHDNIGKKNNIVDKEPNFDKEEKQEEEEEEKTTLLGRAIRFIPTLIFTPILKSSRLMTPIKSTGSSIQTPMKDISRGDMDEVCRMLSKMLKLDEEGVKDDDDHNDDHDHQKQQCNKKTDKNILSDKEATITTTTATNEEGKEDEEIDRHHDNGHQNHDLSSSTLGRYTQIIFSEKHKTDVTVHRCSRLLND